MPKSQQVDGMANRQELSHYNLDFAMETSKKVTQKEIITITDEATFGKSYLQSIWL